MDLSQRALADYLADVAELLERYGLVLDLGPADELHLGETPSGVLVFDLRGFLPDRAPPPRSTLAVREIWRPAARSRYERSEYEYELLDHERGYRRAFHLHDRELFTRRFDVVVHEHCERPVGDARCDHYAGLPVRNAFAGIERLLGEWVDPGPPDCDSLVCLETR